MFSLQQLERKKQDIEERNDLPIQDFVGWDGWERMIKSHIEALQKVEQLQKTNTKLNHEIGAYSGKIHLIAEKLLKLEKEMLNS